MLPFQQSYEVLENEDLSPYFWFNGILGFVHLLSGVLIFILTSTMGIQYCMGTSISVPEWEPLFENFTCFQEHSVEELADHYHGLDETGAFTFFKHLMKRQNSSATATWEDFYSFNLTEYYGEKLVNPCVMHYTRHLLGHIDGLVVLGFFPIITALFHWYPLAYPRTFENGLVSGRYWPRWVEYSITASMMMLVILGLLGVEDLYTLIFGFVLIWSMNLNGGLQEELGRSSLVPTLIGWVQYVVVWFVALYQYAYTNAYSSSPPPEFVTAIVVLMLVLFTSFGVVQLLTLYEVIPFTRGEWIYISLSAISKQLLIWIVFGSLFATSDVTVGQCVL